MLWQKIVKYYLNTLTFWNQIFFIDESLGIIMGEVFLIELTSLIMKQLIEVEICKIVLIFFLDERLGYVTRKVLLIDPTSIILKQFWEELKKKYGAFRSNISYFLLLLLWSSKGTNKVITTQNIFLKISCIYTSIISILIMSVSFASKINIVHQLCINYIFYNFSSSK